MLYFSSYLPLNLRFQLHNPIVQRPNECAQFFHALVHLVPVTLALELSPNRSLRTPTPASNICIVGANSE